MLFRVFFYVNQCTTIAFFLFFAFIIGCSLLENGFGVAFGPATEAVLTVLFYGVVSVLIGGCSFGAALAIDFVIFSRRWELACPLCGASGELENEKKHLLISCPNCGDVGGRVFWDWSIRVYPPGNPTRDWPRDVDFPLVVDLDAGTFCGVRFGEEITLLRALGPVEFAPGLREDDYAYFSRGFEFAGEENTLNSFSVYGAESDDPRFSPFQGLVRFGGKEISVAEITSARAVELFGDPKHQSKYEGHFCLYFERAGIDIDWEFSPAGRFGTLSVAPKVEILSVP